MEELDIIESEDGTTVIFESEIRYGESPDDLSTNDREQTNLLVQLSEISLYEKVETPGYEIYVRSKPFSFSETEAKYIELFTDSKYGKNIESGADLSDIPKIINKLREFLLLLDEVPETEVYYMKKVETLSEVTPETKEKFMKIYKSDIGLMLDIFDICIKLKILPMIGIMDDMLVKTAMESDLVTMVKIFDPSGKASVNLNEFVQVVAALE